MSDSREAFEKWFYDHKKTINANEPFIIEKTSYEAWQHQQKRIDELEAQLAIAVEALESIKQYTISETSVKRATEAIAKIRKIGK